MPEFRIQKTLEQQYPQFLNAVSRDLQLNTAEQTSLQAAHPFLWASWGVSVMSGGENVSYPNKERVAALLDAEAVALFGADREHEEELLLDFKGGIMAQKVQELYLKSARNPSAAQRLQRVSSAVAMWTLTVGKKMGLQSPEWTSFMPQVPQTILASNQESGQLEVSFPGSTKDTYPVDGPTETIVNIGPGLTGAAFATGLAGHADTLHLVSGGMSAQYINTWNTLAIESVTHNVELMRREGRVPTHTKFPPGVTAKTMRIPETIMYDDGIKPALGRLATRTAADVVVMSSVHAAGVEQCVGGLEITKQMLRPGGLLVVKAPVVSLGAEAGMDAVVPPATELFGSPVAQGNCGMVGQYVNPSLPKERPAAYAIYRQAE